MTSEAPLGGDSSEKTSVSRAWQGVCSNTALGRGSCLCSLSPPGFLWHCLSLPHLQWPQKLPRLALVLGVLQWRLGLWPHWQELHLLSLPVWVTMALGPAPSVPLTKTSHS